MAATTLFSATKCLHQYPVSPPHLASSTNSNKSTSSATLSTVTLPKPSLILLRASSSSSISTSSPTSTPQKQEEEDGSSSPSTSDSVVHQSNSINSIPLGGCKACGKAEIERGCNGEGRIQGGIATVPGFGWWPIKAYRPCPGFVATGGRYRRQGQSMDEVAGFGSAPRASSRVTTAKTQSSTKESPRNSQEVKRASKK